jgi:hypothetical protein
VPWSFHHAYVGSPFGAASYLGPRYEPLESGHPPRSTAEPFEIAALRFAQELNPDRLERRRALLDRFEGPASQADSPEAVQRTAALSAQALDLLVQPQVREAFELAREPQRRRDAYGAHEWGQGALLARRLVEAGVTFVMLQCGLRQDWDTHTANFVKLAHELLPPLDRAVAALIEDLASRGLLEQTLVLVLGEFGRTPIVNKDGGRDHWAAVFSALVAGGGVRSGQVVGASDRQGRYPILRGLHAQDLFATMYRVLGIDPSTLLHDRQGRPIPVLGHGTPIAELI